MKKIAIIGLLFLHSYLAIDALAGTKWRQFTVEDGLPSSNITSILQESDEVLWIGTDRGLSRFDGLFTNEFLDMEVNCLLKDSQDRIWVGANEGLWMYSGQEGWREQIEFELTGVKALLEDSHGRIWAGAAAVWGIDRGSPIWVYEDHLGWQEQKELVGKMGWLGIDAILEDSHGVIWVAGVELWRYDINSGWQEQEVFAETGITCLMEDSNGKLWVGTEVDGLWVYDGHTGWQKELDEIGISAVLEDRYGSIWAAGRGLWNPELWIKDEQVGWQELGQIEINFMLEDRNDRIWAGGNGLWMYDYNAGWKKYEELGGVLINFLFEDSHSRIWALADGLWMYDDRAGWREEEELLGKRIEFLLSDSHGRIWASAQWAEMAGRMFSGTWMYDDQLGWQQQMDLAAEWIQALMEDSRGRIWAGTMIGDLWVYDDQMKWQKSELTGSRIEVLTEDSHGRIWVGSDGLWMYSDQTGWHKHRELAEMDIIAILEDSHGRIWVGIEIDGGLWTYSDQVGWQEHRELAGMGVNAILEDSHGRIWAGTDLDGLWIYDNQVGWRKELVDVYGYQFLLEDSSGGIWLGTLDGLWLYEDQKGWSEQVELAGMSILFLFEDSRGRIWVGTWNYGVYAYDKKTSAWHSYTDSDKSLPDNFVNAISEDNHGNILFGTNEGLGIYIPQYSKPRIGITKIDNMPFEKIIADLPYQMGKSTAFVEWIAGDIETESTRLLYQYRIDNDEWSKPTPLSFTTTPMMDDGMHTFSVRAIDRDFNLSEPADVAIFVDTKRPTVLITSPTENEIVSSKGKLVEIRGSVKDEDLGAFYVEYATESRGNFIPISEVDHEVDLGLLAKWQAEELTETQYTIKVYAEDKLGHTNEDTVTVTLDKSDPDVELTTPQDGSRLTKRVYITGKISDDHLDLYELHFTMDADLETALWRQVHTQSVAETVVSVDYAWDIPATISGELFLRLTAIDAAGNKASQIISAEIPQILTKDKGGKAYSADSIVSLSIPPRGLLADETVAINRVPEYDIQQPPENAKSIWLAYDIEPEAIEFHSIKPATLQIRLDNILPQSGGRIALFWWSSEKNKWVFLGGSIQEGKLIAGISQTGRYAVMETNGDAINLSEIGSLFTCQPRVFSPESGQTTISFSLQEAASVTLKLYDIDGRLQKTLVSGSMYAGRNAVLWDGKNEDGEVVPSGLYIITLEADEETVETKTVIVKNR